MANSFSAQVKLEVDGSGLQTQINKAVDAVDISALQATTEAISELFKSIQKGIDDQTFTIKSVMVEEVDCSAAISKMKTQLESALNVVSASTAMSLAGSSTGTSTAANSTAVDMNRVVSASQQISQLMDEVTQKISTAAKSQNQFATATNKSAQAAENAATAIEKQAEAAKNAANAVKEISAENQASYKILTQTMNALSKTYQKNIAGDSSIVNMDGYDSYMKSYNDLLTKVTSAGSDLSAVSQESLVSLQQEATLLIEIVSEYEQQQKAMAEQAAEAEKAAAAEEKVAAAAQKAAAAEKEAADAAALRTSDAAAELKTLEATMSSLTSKYKSNVKGNYSILDSDSGDDWINRYTEAQQEVAKLQQNISSASKEDVSAVRQKVTALLDEVTQYEAAQKAADKQAAAEQKVAEKAAEAARKAQEQAEAQDKTSASMQQTASLAKQMSNYLSSNSKLSGTTYATQIQEMLNTLQSGVPVATSQLNEMKNTFASIQLQAKAAGTAGRTFADVMTAAYEKFGGWSLVTQSLSKAVQYIKQMVTNVVELDTAMTELYKVTDETTAVYNEFFETAISRAQELGATVTDTITATADFARLGYDIDDAATLADTAIIYKNVGDGIDDISDASESIISTMQAFGVAAEDAMTIVDKFNEVGNNFAISSQGVGDALMNSASALATANNSLDESIAMITAANTVVQDPESVGRRTCPAA